MDRSYTQLKFFDYLSFRQFGLSKVHVMFSKHIPVFGKDVYADIKEAQSVEDQNFVFSILVDVFEEMPRHVSPMNSGVDVMGHVVTIVESVLVVHVVDGLVGECAVEFERFEVLFHSGHIWVHKNVLRKVTEHHEETASEPRDDKRIESENVVVVKTNSDDREPNSGPGDTLHGHLIPLLLDSVDWQKE